MAPYGGSANGVVVTVSAFTFPFSSTSPPVIAGVINFLNRFVVGFTVMYGGGVGTLLTGSYPKLANASLPNALPLLESGSTRIVNTDVVNNVYDGVFIGDGAANAVFALIGASNVAALSCAKVNIFPKEPAA